MLGCLKLAGQDHTRAYSLLGLAFTAQFFVCRVIVANAYFARLFGIVAGLMERPWWAWAGGSGEQYWVLCQKKRLAACANNVQTTHVWSFPDTQLHVSAGVAVFGLLNALNLFWFSKLLRMAAGSRRSSRRAAGTAAMAAGAPVAPQPDAHVQQAAVAQHAGAGLVHRSHLGLEKIGTSGGGRPIVNVMAFPGTTKAP